MLREDALESTEPGALDGLEQSLQASIELMALIPPPALARLGRKALGGNG